MAPPELPDDAVAEILLRLPPDEPRCLFHASLVCKLWRRLVADAAFLRRYRRFHRTPPLLGYFFLSDDDRGESIPFFVPTTPASPFPQPVCDRGPWLPLDYRHGRLLLHNEDEGGFTVWDPITGAREEIHEPCTSLTSYSFAVLCAAVRCDHRDCRGGPFLIVWAWMAGVPGLAHVRVYLSQVGSWGTPVSVQVGVGEGEFLNPRNGALAGDHVYFSLGPMGARILNYDLVNHHLSVIEFEPPELYMDIFIVPSEDGLLGVAGIRGSTLHLWSRKANAEGLEGWTRYRVIELRTLLPVVTSFETAEVMAFAEGVRVVYICTDDGHFTIDLSSEQARKVSEHGKQYLTIPFTGFYTPDCACGKFPLPSETN